MQTIVDGTRFWYSTQPSVTRLAEDRAVQYSADEVAEEIRKRLRDEAKIRGDYFSGVHPCPNSGGDVPDELEARLVVLSPEFSHSSKDDKSAARQMAFSILESRGASPRIYRNAIVFAAPDKTRLADLEQAVRRYLAWKSIDRDHEVLNLDAFQGNQAKKKLTDSEETVRSRIPETYQWLLVPGQSETNGPLEWQEVRQQGEEPLAIRAGKKLKSGELLMTEFSGIRLRMELDRVPLWWGDHVSVKQLVEDFAQYLYLPRLKEPEVLLKAVRDGVARLTWQSETFAYAGRWDQSKKRYVGLQAGREIRALMDGQSMLVKPEVAAKQLDADRAAHEQTPLAASPTNGAQSRSPETGTPTTTAGPSADVVSAPVRPRRFHGSVTLDATRLSRDAGKVAEEAKSGDRWIDPLGCLFRRVDSRPRRRRNIQASRHLAQELRPSGGWNHKEATYSGQRASYANQRAEYRNSQVGDRRSRSSITPSGCARQISSLPTHSLPRPKSCQNSPSSENGRRPNKIRNDSVRAVPWSLSSLCSLSAATAGSS